MANTPKPWVELAKQAAAQKKKVLVVEGKYDVAVLNEWLPKSLGSRWTNKVYLVEARNRKSILDGLRWLINENDADKGLIFGLADRDEWETADVAALQAELPMLLVNEERHSIESYFCAPDDIDAILLAHDGATGIQKFGPNLPTLRTQVDAARNNYVAHWALWCTIQRICNRINSSEYPNHFHSQCPLPADADIESKIAEWAGFLNPTTVMASFDKLRTDSLGLPNTQQFRSCVKPKEFFFSREVVSGAYGLSSIESKTTEDWMIELARWSPQMPADLEAVLNPVLT